MTTRLMIARHGNTFTAAEIPTRVGARTDIPLVASGIAQAQALGSYLKSQHLKPAAVFAAQLQRTAQSAQIAMNAAGWDIPVVTHTIFNEIDYGPDENKTEAEVIARIGTKAIEAWNNTAVVPPGWQVDVTKVIANWQNFAKEIEKNYANQSVLVVTSNGIARFAPYLTRDFNEFIQNHSLKISTGALCLFEKDPADTAWRLVQWNLKPY